MKWTESEIEELKQIVNGGWDWYFPGWEWVAMSFPNRTAEACRKKAKKLKI